MDLLRFRDQQARVFEGGGLVTGLDGSGDRLKSEDRLRPLAGVLERHDVPFLQTLDLLKTGNSALVMVQCKVPAAGGTEGDQFDLTVSTLLDANDLEGGVLLTTLLRDPLLPMQRRPCKPAVRLSWRGGSQPGFHSGWCPTQTHSSNGDRTPSSDARPGWLHSVDPSGSLATSVGV